MGYLEIALRLGRLAPDLVESYTGPSELAALVEAEDSPLPAERLREQVLELRVALVSEALERDRRAWLSAQLAALDTALLQLAHGGFDYRQLVERCYGVRSELVPESRFAAAHARLAEALPGRGDVRERYRRWANTQLVAPERLLDGLHTLADELRQRTRALIELPHEEEVTFEIVREKPWSGFADYLGDFRTLIQINEDRPITAGRLLELVSHEAYPGHHTEHVCKDAYLVHELRRHEVAVYVYPTPQALVAEGVAELALEIVLGERADELAAEWLGAVGIDYDPKIAAVHREAAMMMLPLRTNIALLLDDGGSSDEVWSYARRWMLEEDRYVQKALDSILENRWRPYESCYPEGYALCRRFAGGDPSRFTRLLREQLTTSELKARPE